MSPSKAQPRWVGPALAALLAWSFVLRFAFGLPEPRPSRFWDERYGLENVHALLAEGEVRPANGFHPSLSYLPQAVLLGASEGLYRLTGEEAFRVVEGKWVSETAYRLCRFLQAVLGTLSLYFLFLVGRRLFSPAVGFWASFLLSSVYWHIRQSAIYKPDILLVLLTLWAFHLSLRAADRPALRRFLAAGVAIGLALAAKFNAGPIALPLAYAALVAGWRDRRQWVWLAAAGLTAAVVFLALNPWVVLEPGIYQKDFSRTLRDYERKSAEQESSHLYVVWHGFLSLLSSNFHGKLVGFSGVLGSVLFPVLLTGPGSGRRQRRGRVMALVYIAGYTVLYAASTTNASPHNWLPLTPFVALFAAALFVGAWQSLTRWAFPERRRLSAVTASAALALVLGADSGVYTYDEVVPTTREVAEARLVEELRPLDWRFVFYEEGMGRVVARHGPTLAATFGVQRLDKLSEGRLERADAVVFPAEGRAARLAGAEPVAPRWFWARGPELRILFHPWQPRGRPTELRLAADSTQARGELPEDLAAGETVSFRLEVPRKLTVRHLEVGGEVYTLTWAGRRGHRAFYLSERFAASPGAEVRLSYEAPKKASRLAGVRLRLQRWLPPIARRGEG